MVSPLITAGTSGLPQVSGLHTAALKIRSRIFSPSFSDCFFTAMLVWLFVAGANGWNGLLADGDTGWHIRTGEYILDHHRVPTHDLYSFSKSGAPWFAWEWLADLSYAALYRLFGLKGVVLLTGITISLYATLLMRWMLWRNSNIFIAVLITLLAIGSSSIHFLARPHIFTLLFLVVSLWMIDRDRRERDRAVWFLIPITAIWTNVHGGFLAFIACLVLLGVGSAIEGLLSTTTIFGAWGKSRRYVVLTIGCSAASLVNPYGFRLHAHILEYLRSDWIRNAVQEFQSPSFRSESLAQFELLLFLGLLATGLLVRKRKITEAIWLVCFAHLALSAVRHVPLFAIVAAPIIAGELSIFWKRSAEVASAHSVLRVLYQVSLDATANFKRTSIWAALPVVLLVLMRVPLHWPEDFPEALFPIRLIDRHRAELEAKRVFTSDQWADYLIFRFYPRQRVFFDGRSDFYGERTGREFLAVSQGHSDWKSVLDRYAFDAALVPVNWPLASLLKKQDGWRVLEDDGRAIVFIRLSRPAKEASNKPNENGLVCRSI